MNASEFVSKWKDNELSERSACQQHFLDLCDLLNHPKPAELDKTGETFTFERGAEKHGGGMGWADVWKKDFFGWEYKGKHKDLDAAYEQLLKYREALENPPLLVVCDMDRIIVRTNFTGTATDRHEIALDNLGEPRNLEVLRAVFHQPEKLKPGRTSEAITAEAARHLAEIAQGLRERGLDARDVAHFLDRVVFCLFAEDIGLLPEKIFTQTLENTRRDPKRFVKVIGQLFEAMAEGGDFGPVQIRHFNGNLFQPGPVLELTTEEIERIHAAAKLEWDAVDPSIFGTLFVRGMDPAQRAQLGAQYTSRQDIETLVEPVVMAPLRREWDEIKQTVENLLTTGKKQPTTKDIPAYAGEGARDDVIARSGVKGATTKQSHQNDLMRSPRPAEGGTRDDRGEEAATSGLHPRHSRESGNPGEARGGAIPIAGSQAEPGNQVKKLSKAVRLKARREAVRIIQRFVEDLSHIKVLDPACGSANFLYVTLQKLKDLEKEVIVYAGERGLGSFLPFVNPKQLYGIEVSPYAHELAQMTVWIGYLQWTRVNGFGWSQDPVLEPMDNFECKDAILDLSDPDHPKEPDWPKVDFIVGNPPFLGGNKIRQELGDSYVDALFEFYRADVSPLSDLCCYWFEKARRQISRGNATRAGLLATQGIRGGANREVLKNIKKTGDIFFAESDRPWVLEGANVHVSMVGFDDGTEATKILDQREVEIINANLTPCADITHARALRENAGICFMGPSAKGPFDISEERALAMLSEGVNPHGRPNSDVVRLVASATDLVKVDRRRWTIDFVMLDLAEASKYEAPFEYARHAVYPIRSKNRREAYAERWWQYAEARPGLRRALNGCSSFLVTPGVSKHRIFVRRGSEYLCNQGTLVFARSDDYFFGVLHSRVHEVWALRLGTRLETRPRYTPTTCFETFPLPDFGFSILDFGLDGKSSTAPHGGQIQNQQSKIQNEIALAAKELDELRNNRLNPPEWTKEEVLEFPGSADGPWARYVVPASALPGTRTAPPKTGASGPCPRIGLVRYPRIVPKDDACAKKLKKRTLTNLYNERPTWLDLAHKKLDEAVFAAYGWPPDLSDEEILERLLALNLDRAGKE